MGIRYTFRSPLLYCRRFFDRLSNYQIISMIETWGLTAARGTGGLWYDYPRHQQDDLGLWLLRWHWSSHGPGQVPSYMPELEGRKLHLSGIIDWSQHKMAWVDWLTRYDALTSIRSISESWWPVFDSRFLIAGTGPIPMIRGSQPTTTRSVPAADCLYALSNVRSRRGALTHLCTDSRGAELVGSSC